MYEPQPILCDEHRNTLNGYLLGTEAMRTEIRLMAEECPDCCVPQGAES